VIKKLKDWLYKSRFKGLFATDGTLSQKTARSGVWVFGSFGFSKILGFIQMIILARLLVPEDFGLMGICYVAIVGMAVFTNTGFNQALIQRKDHDDDVLNTAWVISVIRGVVLFLLLFILAPFISKFYSTAQIEPILRIIAFSFLFSGFSNIGLILYSKELNFKKKVVYDQITAISSIIITVGLALWLRNVWALVIGHVAGAVIGVGMSYKVHPFKPKFQFRINIAKELFHFGKWVFLSGIILFFITQGDDALVGKVLGISALGFYVLAYKISNWPATAISHVISSVSFPAYAKVQDDIPRLASAYKKVLSFTGIIAMPLAAGLFILAPEFVRIVYGEKWFPMVPALRVLCFFGITRSLNSTFGPIFQAIGKPKVLTKIALSQIIPLIIIIYPLALKYNIVGVAFAVTFVNIIALILCIINSEVYNLTSIIFIKSIYIPAILSFLMVCLLYIMKKCIFIDITCGNLIFLIFTGSLFYFLTSWLFNRRALLEIKKTLGYIV